MLGYHKVPKMLAPEPLGPVAHHLELITGTVWVLRPAAMSSTRQSRMNLRH